MSDRKMPNGEYQRVFRFKLAYQKKLPYASEIYESKPQPILSESDYTRITPAMHSIIAPRHNKLSNQFKDWLVDNGFEEVALERDNIDVSFLKGRKSFMAELKVVYDMGSTRSIREAMGQVFEYNLYPGRNPFNSWLVVLDKKPKETDLSYIGRVQDELSLPLNLGWRMKTDFKFLKSIS